MAQNASQLFKDDEEEQRTGVPSDEQLRHITGISPDEEGAMDREATNGAAEDIGARERGFYNPGDDADTNAQGDDKAADAASLSQAENTPGKLGKGFVANPEMALASRAMALVKRNKGKSSAAGGGALVAIFVAIFGFGSIINYELVTIEKDLQQYETKAEQHFEKKAANHMLSTILCRKLTAGSLASRVAGCKGKESETSAEEEADDANPLAKSIDDFSFTDPDTISALEGENIKVNVDATGNFSGLTDTTTGAAITADDITNDSALADRFETALPEWNVGQLETFRPLMVDQAGASFDILPDTADDDAAQSVENAVLDNNEGGNPDLANASAEDDDVAPGPNASAADQSAFAAGQAESGVAGKALTATDEAIAKGESGTEAIQAGEDASEPSAGSALLASAVISEVCSVKKVADTASKNRVPTIQKLLIRHATTIDSLADQLKDGKITSKEVGGVMSLLNGDSSVKPTAQDSNPEAALPFSSSAAWQRVEGHAPGRNNPEIDDSSKPVADAGTAVVNQVDRVVSDTGVGSFTCKAETSRFGGVINGLAGVVQFAADGFSFGSAQALITAGTIAVQQTIQRVAIPEILKYFTPVGLYGKEFSTQWLNNSDAGYNLAFNVYGKRLGAEPQTNSEASSMINEENRDQAIAENQKSWATRTFAFSDPQSLVSRVAVAMPLSRSQALGSFVSYFSGLPRSIASLFSSIISPSKGALAASDPQNPGEPYGITQYGFSDTDTTKYDPIDNEQYLNTTITYNNQTVKRIAMLGDPNAFPHASDDGSTNDILHCFTNSFTVAPNSTFCGSEGVYDNTQTIQPITDTNVANAYCTYLTGSDNPGCIAAITPQLTDDIGHFRQYILDTHVMGDYTSLQGTNS